MRAPEFPLESTWLNVHRPLSLVELRGHVVLLDFWTYCCINCLHVLPTLEALEEEFAPEPFVVIGVHAAKFDQEKDPENIAAAVRRHGVRHPILADSDHEVWQQYTIRAWPSLVLIDGEGKIVEEMSGEPKLDELRKKIRDRIEGDRSRGILVSEKLEIDVPEVEREGGLAFPGKVRRLPRGEGEAHDRLVISDTGSNRILLADYELDEEGWPRVLDTLVVGSGGVGARNGGYSEASFRRPQGVCRLGSHLYVCDTENHLLRRIDLEAREVSTVGGTGAPALAIPRQPPLETSLRSPWDCAETEDLVLIAMAGAHQIWLYDPGKESLFPVVGTGREDHVDGPFDQCALAQPSSLHRVGVNLIFADSEISSIRIANFESRKVMTIVGKGLFDFGDRDGDVQEVLLQHPLAAVYQDQTVYVADTFNNKIKTIDFRDRKTVTLLGNGDPDLLFEPGGLDVDGDLLFIADTNNHRVRVGKISSQEIRTLTLEF